MRRLVRALAIVAAMGAGVLAITPARHAALRSTGRILVASDQPQPADLIVTDVESGPAGLLTVGDLHRSQPSASVGVLVPRATRIDAEKFLQESGCRWLAKPFRLGDLLRAVREGLT